MRVIRIIGPDPDSRGNFLAEVTDTSPTWLTFVTGQRETVTRYSGNIVWRNCETGKRPGYLESELDRAVWLYERNSRSIQT